MKYFILTIVFIFIIALLITGSIFYGSWNYWSENRQAVFRRLLDLKSAVEHNEGEVILTPDLKITGRSLIYDRNLQVIASISPGSGKIYSLDEIPAPILKALLITEEPGFYTRGSSSHRVLDILSLVLEGKSIEGQLSCLLLPEGEKKVNSYLIRLLCNLELERRFSRDDILTFYINSVWLGGNLYGIDNGAGYYFNKPASDLDLFEAALLFSIIKDPPKFSPLLNPLRSMKRHKIVLNKLVQEGLIDTLNAAKRFDELWEHFPANRHPYDTAGFHVYDNRAPYFVEYVRQVLNEKAGMEMFNTGGLRIYTTLDIYEQAAASETLIKGLIRQARRTVAVTGFNNKNVEGAIFVMDPLTGQVLAMVGGSGFTTDNQFNRAISARRQIGSAFKPFVYAAAFETLDITKDTVFVDKPLEIRTDDGIWRPQNYNGEYYGEVSLAFAMKKSLNSVAVQLGQETGIDRIIDLIKSALELDPGEADRRFKPFPSAALGVYSFSPMEIASAYSIFPNGGRKIIPVSILKVEDADGKVIISADPVESKRVISKSTSSMINEMLEGVLTEGGTAYDAVATFVNSPGGQERNIPRWMGKTGTTNDFTDAWFIGYDDAIIATVWVGFDDPSNSLGDGQSGGVAAAPIWVEYMKKSTITGR